MAGVGPMTQDSEPVAPNSAAKRDEKTVNAARRSGLKYQCEQLKLLQSHLAQLLSRQVQLLVNEINAGSNKAASSGTSSNLDDETENLTALGERKLTQSQLAQLLLPVQLLVDETVKSTRFAVPTELKKLIREAGEKKLTRSQLALLLFPVQVLVELTGSLIDECVPSELKKAIMQALGERMTQSQLVLSGQVELLDDETFKLIEECEPTELKKAIMTQPQLAQEVTPIKGFARWKQKKKLKRLDRLLNKVEIDYKEEVEGRVLDALNGRRVDSIEISGSAKTLRTTLEDYRRQIGDAVDCLFAEVDSRLQAVKIDPTEKRSDADDDDAIAIFKILYWAGVTDTDIYMSRTEP